MISKISLTKQNEIFQQHRYSFLTDKPLAVYFKSFYIAVLKTAVSSICDLVTVPEVTFLRFGEGICSIIVVSDFCFGEVLFLVPPKSQITRKP